MWQEELICVPGLLKSLWGAAEGTGGSSTIPEVSLTLGHREKERFLWWLLLLLI